MKLLYRFCLFLALFGATRISAQHSFYEINTVQDIKLTFFQSNWDAILDSLKSADEEVYLLAKSVEVNGELFDSVGVKYKGNSSYKASNQKNPMHIELNYVHKNKDYKGLTDIKLSNGFSDPSFIREALSYQILRNYMDVPESNFAKLSINGQYWGLYGNTESINKRFVKDHFYTAGDNPFFKCNPQSIGGPGGGGGGFPDLVYSSADSTTYYKKYEIKSDHGWRELLGLMDTLKNHPSNLAKVADVDRMIWMLAFNSLFVNLDSYTGAFGQNYYLYQDDNQRFLPVVWDLNMSFGGFQLLTSGGGGGGSMLSLVQMQNLDPLTQASNASRPLIQKILANPTWKRRYIAHMKTMLLENFGGNMLLNQATEIQSVIDSAVQADTKKFFTYTNFLSNVTQTVPASGGGGGGFTPPGITQLMTGRYTYLTQHALFTATAPTINTPAVSPTNPAPGTTVWITAQVQNTNNVEFYHRNNTWDIFQKLPMFDDGQHQDGAANDGVYGVSIPAGLTKIQYYIFAENNDAGMFSPQRAEYEFHTITSQSATANVGDVVINEFLAVNKEGATDEVGQHDDWLELYNKTNQPKSLAGLFLTDDVTKPDRWEFPADAVIAANGFLIVWLDDDATQGPLHAKFKLSSDGEFLMLSNGADIVYDSLTYGVQGEDISYGRFPNGTGSFTYMPMTFNAVNSLVIATDNITANDLVKLFPNPTQNMLHVESDVVLGNIRIFNTLGKLVGTYAADRMDSANVSVADLPNGIYWVKVGQNLPVKVVIER